MPAPTPGLLAAWVPGLRLASSRCARTSHVMRRAAGHNGDDDRSARPYDGVLGAIPPSLPDRFKQDAIRKGLRIASGQPISGAAGPKC